MTWLEPDDEEDDWEPPTVEPFQVAVTDPIVLAELLGPDGEVRWQLLDRRLIDFGFQPSDVAETPPRT